MDLKQRYRTHGRECDNVCSTEVHNDQQTGKKSQSRSLLQDIKLKNEPKHGCEKSIAELIKLTMYFKKTQLW